MKKATIEARAAEALRYLTALRDGGANWVQGHNAMNGPAGKVAELFPSKEERSAWSKTAEYQTMWQVLGGLPRPAVVAQPPQQENGEPREHSGVLNVRMPKTLHAALAQEAEAEGVSLNHLIVAKLAMQMSSEA